MDEVEDLQSDISILRDQLKRLSHDKAYHEVRLMQATDSLNFYKTDNEELRAQVRDLKCELISAEIEREMQKISGVSSLAIEHQGSN